MDSRMSLRACSWTNCASKHAFEIFIDFPDGIAASLCQHFSDNRSVEDRVTPVTIVFHQASAPVESDLIKSIYQPHCWCVQKLIESLQRAILRIMGGVTIGFLLQGYIEDENHPFESRKWIWLHYGTAYRATYTMYEITMAGNWPTNVRPVLENVSHAYVFFFVGYITVVVFAIIRVITAIFLSQTLEAANNDVEVMIQERMRKKSMFVEQLEGIFEAIDESGDGLLSEEEMKELLADSKVQAYMESLEVALPESEALFRLLQNSDGQITYEDFIEGILRCKGPARAVDQIVLHSEVKSLNTLIQKLQDKMEEAHLIQTCKRRRNKKHHTGLASHMALLSSPTRSRASLYVK